MIKLSILIPVRYDNSFLKESLDSVLTQLEKGWELVLINDQMEPSAWEKIKHYEKKYSGLRLKRNPGLGLVAALNYGLSLCRGDYIARMDADDLALPGRFRKQVEYLDQNQDVGLVSCLIQYGGNREKQEGYALHVDWINALQSHELMHQKRYAEAVVAHPSVMFRKTLLTMGRYRRNNAENMPIPEDFDLWLRWFQQGVRFAKIPEHLLQWNDLPNRLSRHHPAYDSLAFRRSAAEHFQIEANKAYWIWGKGKTINNKLKPFIDRGLSIAGYIDFIQSKDDQKPPTIAYTEVPKLPDNAMVLIFVGQREGKEAIQKQLDQWAKQEGKDYLWMV